MHLLVGHLAFATTAAERRQVFASYGEVASGRMMTDRDTGRSRGFGFVEMPDSTAAQSTEALLPRHTMDTAFPLHRSHGVRLSAIAFQCIRHGS